MDKVTRQAVLNRGPSAYQPNALPLGQTGSQASGSIHGPVYTPWFCPFPVCFPGRVWCSWSVCFLWVLGPRVGCPGVTAREPVWPSDNPDKQTELGSNLLRLSFLFKSCGLWTPSCGFVPHSYETLKWLSSAAHLNAEVILVVTV